MLRYLYLETVLCLSRVFMCKPPPAISVAPENSMDLILFAFRTNFKFWRECCSLSKACWTIWMDECVEFEKQSRNCIIHVQMGATVGYRRCYIVYLNDEQDCTQNRTLRYSLWQGQNTECPHYHIIMIRKRLPTRKGTQIPLFVFAFFITGAPETNSKIAWPNNFQLLPRHTTIIIQHLLCIEWSNPAKARRIIALCNTVDSW